MEFQQVVRRRHMVRAFDARPIPPELLNRILENGQHGPSAGHTQGYAFLVLEGAEQTRRYWNAVLPAARRKGFPWPGLLHAPVLIIALADKQAYLERYAEADKQKPAADSREWPTPYWHIDTGFAALLMLLTATDAGLGTLFFSVANIAAFRDAFDVPERMHPIGAIALGYPGPGRRSSSLRRGRRPVADVVHRENW